MTLLPRPGVNCTTAVVACRASLAEKARRVEPPKPPAWPTATAYNRDAATRSERNETGVLPKCKPGSSSPAAAAYRRRFTGFGPAERGK